MRLRDLEARFYRITAPGHRLEVDTLAEAQGVLFLCPACFKTNNGPIGTHSVMTWFRDRGVPDDEVPRPGRWQVASSSTGLDDLTLTPSVLLPGPGCGWHGFVTNGDAQ